MAKQTETLDTYVENRWWIGVAQGIMAILFGLAALFWPGLTIVTLVYLFGVWLLLAGIIELILGVAGIGRRGSWVLTLLLGIAQLIIGIYLLRHPGVSFSVLIGLMGLALLLFGVFEGVSVFVERGTSATEKTLVVITSLFAIVAGIVVLAQPAASGLAFIWIVGLFALVYGPVNIALALDMKHLGDELKA